MHNPKLMNNPLKTRNDVKDALLELLHPLEGCFSQYGLKYGSGTAQHGDFVGEIEAVARPLWGISPLMAAGDGYQCFEKYLEKIIEGTNPTSKGYWGVLLREEQRMVEMASISVGMIIARKHYWDALTQPQQDNLYNWLAQINHHEIHVSNWRFFRILVNLAFKLCDRQHDQARLTQDLETIDSMYIARGWYTDGIRPQIDYYIPFAIHFCGLLYATYADFDPVYPPLFKQRAIEFAKTFPAFFASSGEAIPFGRSMTYRFAMSAFFGALALSGIEAIPWGEVKYLALQNLRHWFKQDIFTDNGELSIGYYYPNLVMAEAYNAFGSTYWAMKAFMFMAVPQNHPFWTAKEKAPKLPDHIPIPEARGIIQGDDTQRQFFVVGQHAAPWLSHAQSKYEKFVYSSHFGFSVPKSTIGLSQGAFDNTLAVCENDDFYRMKYGVESYQIYDDYLYSKWKPWSNVIIESYIIPIFPWHVRIHMVDTKRKLALADGGFAIDRQGGLIRINDDNCCAVIRPESISAMINLYGQQQPIIVQTEPNTNLMTPLTLIPTLTATVSPGIYTFASAILGATGESPESYLEESPALTVSTEEITIYYKGNVRRVPSAFKVQ